MAEELSPRQKLDVLREFDDWRQVNAYGLGFDAAINAYEAHLIQEDRAERIAALHLALSSPAFSPEDIAQVKAMLEALT